MLKDLLIPYKIFDKIRLGSPQDGGYVVSSQNLRSNRLVSVGCDNQTSFEEHFLNINPHSVVDIYDKNDVCDFASRHPNVNFYNIEVNNFEQLSIDSNCIVQMDIEGSEYDVFSNYNGNFEHIQQLIIEFHFKFKGDSSGWENVLKKINESFYLVHVHGNNCAPITEYNPVPDVIECTYINKNHLTHTMDKEDVAYPLQNLDKTNCSNKDDFVLSWWL
tara:strand:+ start:863 stop:1516 length:654 start_codon:yes stop_codon:yes gene_type:complete